MDFSDPELLKLLLGIGSNESEGDQLSQQQEMVQALRQPQQHSTGWGGALGALAQGLNGLQGGLLMKQQGELAAKRRKMLDDYIAEQQRRQQQQNQPMEVGGLDLNTGEFFKG